MTERFAYDGVTIETSRRYRHVTTGKQYRPLHSVVIHEASLSPMVVYQRVDVENDDTIWARPMAAFLERFEVVPLHEYAAPSPQEAKTGGK